MFFILRKSGQVVSYSDEAQNEFDPEIFDQIEKDVTDEQLNQINNSKAVHIVDGEFVFTPQEDNSETQEFIDKIKNGTATQEDKDQMLIRLLQKTQIG